jgi:hypothetical protein
LNSFNNLSSNYSQDYYLDLEKSNRLKDSISLISDSSTNTFLSTDPASYSVNNTTDGKFSNNLVKPLLATNSTRKVAIDGSEASNLDLANANVSSVISSKFSNLESSSKFKDLKSPNMGFLSTDKNSRLISKIHTSKGQFNLSSKNSNLADIISQVNSESSSNSDLAVYNASIND